MVSDKKPFLWTVAVSARCSSAAHRRPGLPKLLPSPRRIFKLLKQQISFCFGFFLTLPLSPPPPVQQSASTCRQAPAARRGHAPGGGGLWEPAGGDPHHDQISPALQPEEDRLSHLCRGASGATVYRKGNVQSGEPARLLRSDAFSAPSPIDESGTRAVLAHI